MASSGVAEALAVGTTLPVSGEVSTPNRVIIMPPTIPTVATMKPPIADLTDPVGRAAT